MNCQNDSGTYISLEILLETSPELRGHHPVGLIQLLPKNSKYVESHARAAAEAALSTSTTTTTTTSSPHSSFFNQTATTATAPTATPAQVGQTSPLSYSATSTATTTTPSPQHSTIGSSLLAQKDEGSSLSSSLSSEEEKGLSLGSSALSQENKGSSLALSQQNQGSVLEAAEHPLTPASKCNSIFLFFFTLLVCKCTDTDVSPPVSPPVSPRSPEPISPRHLDNNRMYCLSHPSTKQLI